MDDCLLYLRGSLVLDEITEVCSWLRRVVLGSHGSIEAVHVHKQPAEGAHLTHGSPEPFGDLPVGGLASELCREFVAHARRSARLRPRVYRQAYGATLVFDGPPYGLPYPPRRVGREAVAHLGVELLDGPDEPHVAFLDKILEGQDR